MTLKYRLNDLNRKIKLEEFKNGVWILKKCVWGKLEVNLNALSSEHGILENKNSYTVIIRNFIVVSELDRFVYKDIVLYVKHIDTTDSEYLKILCEDL